LQGQGASDWDSAKKPARSIVSEKSISLRFVLRLRVALFRCVRKQTIKNIPQIPLRKLRNREACGKKFDSRLRRKSFLAAGVEAQSARRQDMPARETEAIILKTFPLGEADRLVSFLGRSSGRLRGVASGARRIKNRYGSTLEILSHVQLWYVERETRDLVRIQQCELLESFHKAQSDYGLATGLAMISEIAERVLPEQEVADAMFRLLLLAAREVERRASWQLPLAYFAFWTVRLGGWLPPLGRCAICGSVFGERPAFHYSQSAGLVCDNCRKPGMRPLGQGGRKFAELFATRKLDQIEVPDEAMKALTELREAALSWIEFHTERKLQTREFLETT
jgi:DNA repair protein RecO (recombination protein O)